MDDGGGWITTLFVLIGCVVFAVGLGISAYRVSVARRRALAAGEDPKRAMLRSLAGEDDATDDQER
jgi:hypothetical protein